MRVSSDDDSWRADGVRRRDFRHARVGPEAPRHRRAQRKDVWRWCRGRVGRDHVLEQYEFSRWVSTDADGVEHVHVRLRWRCARCLRTEVDRFPAHLRAVCDDRFAAGWELEQRWCGDGHLWGDVVLASWWFGRRASRRRGTCVMCGLLRGSSPKQFVAVDPPVQL